jgi:hypothetical protein
MLYVNICDVDSFFSTGMASWTDFIGDFRSEFLSFIVDGITEVLPWISSVTETVTVFDDMYFDSSSHENGV